MSQDLTVDGLASDARVQIRRRGVPDPDGHAVIYWMQRAQRGSDNPALDVAIALGNRLRKPVVVFFGVNPYVLHANLRHYQFLVEGLEPLAEELRRRRVGFVLRAAPDHRLAPFLEEVPPAIVIGDESPLRQAERWRAHIAELVKTPFWTVDADVVVPTRLLEKEQYAARTIRPRLHKHYREFLAPSADPAARVPWTPPKALARLEATAAILDGLPIDRSLSAAALEGGTRAARRLLRRFIRRGLSAYDTERNLPECEGTSRLSAYLHFGHIGPREVARAVADADAPRASVDAFLEQLIVRRELAINFVRFNDVYDRLDGCEPWARQTLRRHAFDTRPFVYSRHRFEAAETHDPLWNAAQRQMVATGWMHGYIRMYWAKKILEWSREPAEAFETAIALNDRYELDGRDPNGYANIAWAIGGKHDRPWPSRPVYGSIRSMSFEGTQRKFDALRYVEQHGTASDIAVMRRQTRASR